MKRILPSLCLLFGCLTAHTMAQSLSAKVFSLGHPANGSVEKIGSYLVVSGHSVRERWLTLVNLDDFDQISVEIPSNAQFFGRAQLADAEVEQLVFLTTEGVSVYRPDSGESDVLIQSSSAHPVVDSERLAYMDLTRDITGSGLSDFLIPDFNTYHLFVQQSNGDFIAYQLELDAQVQVRDRSPRYTPRQPYFLDVNLDGRTDLVFVRDSQLAAFVQQDDTSFPEQPQMIELKMPISSDSEANLRASDGRDFDGLIIHRVHDLLDLDGDGLADLVVRKEEFSSAVEQSYTYHIYYGQRGESGLAFADQPDTRIETRGIQFEPVFTDLNGNGRKDFYTPSAEFGVGTIIRALISGSARVDIAFYLMDESRQFDKEPNYSHRAKGEVSIGAGRFDLPLVKVADLDGSGAKSLIVGENRKELMVHAAAGDQLFERRAKGFSTPLPRDGAQVRVMDLNDDGKDDLVLPFDAQDDAKAKNQLHLLLVQ